MSNLEKFLAAIMSGDTTGLPEPETNVEKYLAKALGVWGGDIPVPKSRADAYLYQLAVNGTGGKLPELVNPAESYKILEGYEAIDQDGNVIVGDMPDHTGHVVLVQVDMENERVIVPYGFHDGFTGVAIDVESQDVIPSNAQQVIYPSEGKVLGKVTVEAVPDAIAIADATYFFYQGKRLEQIEELLPLFKGTTDMTCMFMDGTGLVNADLHALDTSATERMYRMFYRCGGLKSIDASTWDTSKVTDMGEMFSMEGGSSSLESIDTSNWDTSSLKKANKMFANNTKLTRFDMSNWDTSKITDMAYIFTGCSALEEIIGFSCCGVKASLAYYFPYDLGTLKRLTFRTDLPEGQLALRSPVYIRGCAFERAAMVETFNTLPDVSGWIDLPDEIGYLELEIAGRSVLSKINQFKSQGKVTEDDVIKVIDADGNVYSATVAECLSEMGVYDESGTLVSFNSLGNNPVTLQYPTTVNNSLPETHRTITITNNPCVTGTLSDGTACETLTDEDRAIATDKGWILVE